ncbi:MAG: aldo/keto reductase, partial [Phototrophicaceae bacterium]
RYRFENEYERLYHTDTLGLGTTIWSPLASGLLTGKYNQGIPDESRVNLAGYEWLKEIFMSTEGQARLEKVKQLAEVAQELGTTMPKLALAWCIKNPNVSTVITGASKVSQVEENFSALDVVPLLTDEVMEKIEGILNNKHSKLIGAS